MFGASLWRFGPTPLLGWSSSLLHAAAGSVWHQFDNHMLRTGLILPGSPLVRSITTCLKRRRLRPAAGVSSRLAGAVLLLASSCAASAPWLPVPPGRPAACCGLPAMPTAISNGHRSRTAAAQQATSRLAPCPLLTLAPWSLHVPFAAYQPDVAIRAKTIREFDDAITRIAFGWPNGEARFACAPV